MKYLFSLILLIPSLSFSDHYKTGIFFQDPYIFGCIYEDIHSFNGYEGTKCALQSPKFFWNENKHIGSEEKAKKDCYKFLESMISDVYKDISSSSKLWIKCGDVLYSSNP